MNLVAALVVSTVAQAGEPPAYHMPQSWEGPTETDLIDCATMATELSQAYRAMVDKGLNRDWQEKWVTCEVTVSTAQPDGPAKKVSFTF